MPLKKTGVLHAHERHRGKKKKKIRRWGSGWKRVYESGHAVRNYALFPFSRHVRHPDRKKKKKKR